jgi:hypothetical protein
MAGISGSVYLSDIDEPTHKVLVAERRDGVLGLLPRSIFHDTDVGLLAGRSQLGVFMDSSEDLPASLQFPADSVPTRQSNDSIKIAKTQRKTSQDHLKPTFDIPFGSSNTSAKRTSPAGER